MRTMRPAFHLGKRIIIAWVQSSPLDIPFFVCFLMHVCNCKLLWVVLYVGLSETIIKRILFSCPIFERGLGPTHAEPQLTTCGNIATIKTWSNIWLLLVWVRTRFVLVVEIKGAIMRDHTSIDVVICAITNRWVIEIINEGWSIIFEMHRLRGICISWLFFFITLGARTLGTSWIYDSSTRIGLVIEWFLRIEFLFSITHSLFILLLNISSIKRGSILAKAWRSITCWSFMECHRGKRLFASSGSIRNHWTSTTVSIVTPSSNSWVTRPDTEITPIRVTRISTLAFTFPCTDIMFAIRSSLHTANPTVGSRCRLLCNFLLCIFWRCSCHLLTPTRCCTLRSLRGVSTSVTVVGCSLCIFLDLLFV